MSKPFIYSVKSGSTSMNGLDWKTMFGGVEDDDLDEHGAYQAVAWVRRCLELRCNALSAIPCNVYQGKAKPVAPAQGGKPKQEQEPIEWEFADLLPRMLWQTEASLQLYGAAYWLREANRVKEKGYRWLSPKTITPKYNPAQGLTHFERNIGQTTVILKPDELIYLWSPNLVAEVGPGSGWVTTVLTESSIAKNMNEFADGFFERGAIPGMLLSVEGSPLATELERLEQWWRRLMQGVKHAWETVAVKATVTPVVVGYPTDQLAMPELLLAVREQIAVAAGVPQTMLEDAANYATAAEHHQAFYEETVVPQAGWIEAVLNKQLFGPLDLRLALDWQSLDIFQEDEAERAAALQQLTSAGVPLDLAMEMLGMELPNEMTYKQLRARLEEDKQKAQEQQVQLVQERRPEPGEQREELRRWQRKATKALKDGKPANVDFDTDALAADEQSAIRERLTLATTDEEVKAAFLLPFRAVGIAPIGTGLEPYNGEVVISEEDIKAAFAEWDRLMPEQYRGLLDARTEEP